MLQRLRYCYCLKDFYPLSNNCLFNINEMYLTFHNFYKGIFIIIFKKLQLLRVALVLIFFFFL